MELDEFYSRITLRDGVSDVPASTSAHAVLAALSGHLTPAAARDLALVLPKQLRGTLLEYAIHPLQEFDRDAFLEEVASRLDVDDDDAEHAALAVLGAIRDGVRPRYTVEQLIEELPSDLAHLMHEIPPASEP